MERFLNAARELIGKRGNDAVSIREVAVRAGVPISSVYDYFPDRTAIVRALMAGYMVALNERLALVLDDVRTPRQIPSGTDRLVDTFVAFFRAERELGPIWAAVQANTELRGEDVENGHRIAGLIASRFIGLSPRCDAAGIRTLVLYVVNSIVPVSRVVVYSSPKDGPALLAELKTLIRLRLQTLIPELRAPQRVNTPRRARGRKVSALGPASRARPRSR